MIWNEFIYTKRFLMFEGDGEGGGSLGGLSGSTGSEGGPTTGGGAVTEGVGTAHAGVYDAQGNFVGGEYGSPGWEAAQSATPPTETPPIEPLPTLAPPPPLVSSKEVPQKGPEAWQVAGEQPTQAQLAALEASKDGIDRGSNEGSDPNAPWGWSEKSGWTYNNLAIGYGPDQAKGGLNPATIPLYNPGKAVGLQTNTPLPASQLSRDSLPVNTRYVLNTLDLLGKGKDGHWSQAQLDYLNSLPPSWTSPYDSKGGLNPDYALRGIRGGDLTQFLQGGGQSNKLGQAMGLVALDLPSLPAPWGGLDSEGKPATVENSQRQSVGLPLQVSSSPWLGDSVLASVGVANLTAEAKGAFRPSDMIYVGGDGDRNRGIDNKLVALGKQWADDNKAVGEDQKRDNTVFTENPWLTGTDIQVMVGHLPGNESVMLADGVMGAKYKIDGKEVDPRVYLADFKYVRDWIKNGRLIDPEAGKPDNVEFIKLNYIKQAIQNNPLSPSVYKEMVKYYGESLASMAFIKSTEKDGTVTYSMRNSVLAPLVDELLKNSALNMPKYEFKSGKLVPIDIKVAYEAKPPVVVAPLPIPAPPAVTPKLSSIVVDQETGRMWDTSKPNALKEVMPVPLYTPPAKAEPKPIDGALPIPNAPKKDSELTPIPIPIDKGDSTVELLSSTPISKDIYTDLETGKMYDVSDPANLKEVTIQQTVPFDTTFTADAVGGFLGHKSVVGAPPETKANIEIQTDKSGAVGKVIWVVWKYGDREYALEFNADTGRFTGYSDDAKNRNVIEGWRRDSVAKNPQNPIQCTGGDCDIKEGQLKGGLAWVEKQGGIFKVMADADKGVIPANAQASTDLNKTIPIAKDKPNHVIIGRIPVEQYQKVDPVTKENIALRIPNLKLDVPAVTVQDFKDYIRTDKTAVTMLTLSGPSWCGPCVNERKEVLAIMDDYKGQLVNFMLYDVDSGDYTTLLNDVPISSSADTSKFSLGGGRSVGSIIKGADGKQYLKVPGSVPITVVIKDGEIVNVQTGEQGKSNIKGIIDSANPQSIVSTKPPETVEPVKPKDEAKQVDTPKTTETVYPVYKPPLKPNTDIQTPEDYKAREGEQWAARQKTVIPPSVTTWLWDKIYEEKIGSNTVTMYKTGDTVVVKFNESSPNSTSVEYKYSDKYGDYVGRVIGTKGEVTTDYAPIGIKDKGDGVAQICISSSCSDVKGDLDVYRKAVEFITVPTKPTESSTVEVTPIIPTETKPSEPVVVPPTKPSEVTETPRPVITLPKDDNLWMSLGLNPNPQGIDDVISNIVKGFGVLQLASMPAPFNLALLELQQKAVAGNIKADEASKKFEDLMSQYTESYKKQTSLMNKLAEQEAEQKSSRTQDQIFKEYSEEKPEGVTIRVWEALYDGLSPDYLTNKGYDKDKVTQIYSVISNPAYKEYINSNGANPLALAQSGVSTETLKAIGFGDKTIAEVNEFMSKTTQERAEYMKTTKVVGINSVQVGEDKFKNPIFMDEKSYNQLPEAQQKILKEQGWESWQKAIDSAKEKLKDFTRPDGSIDIVTAVLTAKSSKALSAPAGLVMPKGMTASDWLNEQLTKNEEIEKAVKFLGGDDKINEITKKIDTTRGTGLIKETWEAITPWDESKGQQATPVEMLAIAPMIMYPFVELAFKANILSPAEKIFMGIVDTLSLIPGARANFKIMSAMRKAGFSMSDAISRVVSSEVIGPYYLVRHPGAVIKAPVRAVLDMFDNKRSQQNMFYQSTQGMGPGHADLKITQVPDVSRGEAIHVANLLGRQLTQTSDAVTILGDKVVVIKNNKLMELFKSNGIETDSIRFHQNPVGEEVLKDIDISDLAKLDDVQKTRYDIIKTLPANQQADAQWELIKDVVNKKYGDISGLKTKLSDLETQLTKTKSIFNKSKIQTQISETKRAIDRVDAVEQGRGKGYFAIEDKSGEPALYSTTGSGSWFIRGSARGTYGEIPVSMMITGKKFTKVPEEIARLRDPVLMQPEMVKWAKAGKLGGKATGATKNYHIFQELETQDWYYAELVPVPSGKPQTVKYRVPDKDTVAEMQPIRDKARPIAEEMLRLDKINQTGIYDKQYAKLKAEIEELMKEVDAKYQEALKKGYDDEITFDADFTRVRDEITGKDIYVINFTTAEELPNAKPIFSNEKLMGDIDRSSEGQLWKDLFQKGIETKKVSPSEYYTQVRARLEKRPSELNRLNAGINLHSQIQDSADDLLDNKAFVSGIDAIEDVSPVAAKIVKDHIKGINHIGYGSMTSYSQNPLRRQQGAKPKDGDFAVDNPQLAATELQTKLRNAGEKWEIEKTSGGGGEGYAMISPNGEKKYEFKSISEHNQPKGRYGLEDYSDLVEIDGIQYESLSKQSSNLIDSLLRPGYGEPLLYAGSIPEGIHGGESIGPFASGRPQRKKDIESLLWDAQYLVDRARINSKAWADEAQINLNILMGLDSSSKSLTPKLASAGAKKLGIFHDTLTSATKSFGWPKVESQARVSPVQGKPKNAETLITRAKQISMIGKDMELTVDEASQIANGMVSNNKIKDLARKVFGKETTAADIEDISKILRDYATYRDDVHADKLTRQMNLAERLNRGDFNLTEKESSKNILENISMLPADKKARLQLMVNQAKNGEISYTSLYDALRKEGIILETPEYIPKTRYEKAIDDISFKVQSLKTSTDDIGFEINKVALKVGGSVSNDLRMITWNIDLCVQEIKDAVYRFKSESFDKAKPFINKVTISVNTKLNEVSKLASRYANLLSDPVKFKLDNIIRSIRKQLEQLEFRYDTTIFRATEVVDDIASGVVDKTTKIWNKMESLTTRSVVELKQDWDIALGLYKDDIQYIKSNISNFKNSPKFQQVIIKITETSDLLSKYSTIIPQNIADKVMSNIQFIKANLKNAQMEVAGKLGDVNKAFVNSKIYAKASYNLISVMGQVEQLGIRADRIVNIISEGAKGITIRPLLESISRDIKSIGDSINSISVKYLNSKFYAKATWDELEIINAINTMKEKIANINRLISEAFRNIALKEIDISPILDSIKRDVQFVGDAAQSITTKYQNSRFYAKSRWLDVNITESIKSVAASVAEFDRKAIESTLNKLNNSLMTVDRLLANISSKSAARIGAITSKVNVYLDNLETTINNNIGRINTDVYNKAKDSIKSIRDKVDSVVSGIDNSKFVAKARYTQISIDVDMRSFLDNIDIAERRIFEASINKINSTIAKINQLAFDLTGRSRDKIINLSNSALGNIKNAEYVLVNNATKISDIVLNNIKAKLAGYKAKLESYLDAVKSSYEYKLIGKDIEDVTSKVAEIYDDIGRLPNRVATFIGNNTNWISWDSIRVGVDNGISEISDKIHALKSNIINSKAYAQAMYSKTSVYYDYQKAIAMLDNALIRLNKISTKVSTFVVGKLEWNDTLIRELKHELDKDIKSILKSIDNSKLYAKARYYMSVDAKVKIEEANDLLLGWEKGTTTKLRTDREEMAKRYIRILEIGLPQQPVSKMDNFRSGVIALRSVTPVSDSESTKDVKYKNLKQLFANLPPVAKGYVRVVHATDRRDLKSIQETGFHFFNTIYNTVVRISGKGTKKELDYIGRFAGGVRDGITILDIPKDEFNKFAGKTKLTESEMLSMRKAAVDYVETEADKGNFVSDTYWDAMDALEEEPGVFDQMLIGTVPPKYIIGQGRFRSFKEGGVIEYKSVISKPSGKDYSQYQTEYPKSKTGGEVKNPFIIDITEDKRIGENGGVWVSARIDNKEAGRMILNYKTDGNVFIEDMIVKPEFRGKHVATDLFFKVIEFTKNKGIKVELGAGNLLPDGKAFYKALNKKGYIPIIPEGETLLIDPNAVKAPIVTPIEPLKVDLPPIPNGYTRFYRGEHAEGLGFSDFGLEGKKMEWGVGDKFRGRYYTKDIDSAINYTYDQKGSVLKYIDVPNDDVSKYAIDNITESGFDIGFVPSDLKGNYILIPTELKDKATSINYMPRIEAERVFKGLKQLFIKDKGVAKETKKIVDELAGIYGLRKLDEVGIERLQSNEARVASGMYHPGRETLGVDDFRTMYATDDYVDTLLHELVHDQLMTKNKTKLDDAISSLNEHTWLSYNLTDADVAKYNLPSNVGTYVLTTGVKGRNLNGYSELIGNHIFNELVTIKYVEKLSGFSDNYYKQYLRDVDGVIDYVLGDIKEPWVDVIRDYYKGKFTKGNVIGELEKAADDFVNSINIPKGREIPIGEAYRVIQSNVDFGRLKDAWQKLGTIEDMGTLELRTLSQDAINKEKQNLLNLIDSKSRQISTEPAYSSEATTPASRSQRALEYFEMYRLVQNSPYINDIVSSNQVIGALIRQGDLLRAKEKIQEIEKTASKKETAMYMQPVNVREEIKYKPTDKTTTEDLSKKTRFTSRKTGEGLKPGGGISTRLPIDITTPPRVEAARIPQQVEDAARVVVAERLIQPEYITGKQIRYEPYLSEDLRPIRTPRIDRLTQSSRIPKTERLTSEVRLPRYETPRIDRVDRTPRTERVTRIERTPRVERTPRLERIPARLTTRLRTMPRLPKRFIPPMKQADKVSLLTKEQKDSAIAWKQGFMYKMRFKPWRQIDIINTREPIEGVHYGTGPRSAYESVVAKFGTNIPPSLEFDMGIMKTRFTKQTGKTASLPEITYEERPDQAKHEERLSEAEKKQIETMKTQPVPSPSEQEMAQPMVSEQIVEPTVIKETMPSVDNQPLKVNNVGSMNKRKVKAKAGWLF